MQKMFVIYYYINKQILDSYLHTMSEKIWLLFTFALNWVFFAVSMATAGILKFQSLKTIYTHAIQHFY
jgi:hypothetical protein